MGNKVARILLGIIIACGILVGGYYILPAKFQNPITQFIQKQTNDNYDVLVNACKNGEIPKNKKVTFGEAFDERTESVTWLIEEFSVDEKGNGEYYVYGQGFNFTVALESNDNDDSLKTATNASYKVSFDVIKDGNTIKINNKEVKEGKPIYPTSIEVDQDVYSQTGADDYYQQCLNALAGR